MYILIAILGYAALAAVNLLDKLLVSSAGAKQSPFVVAFYSTVPLLGLFVLILLSNTSFDLAPLDWWLAVISGLTFVGALLTMYQGLIYADVSYNGPLVGAVTTLVTVGAAALLLAERLTGLQLVGIVLLLIGSIITTKKQNHHIRWRQGLIFAILAGVFFAVSNIFAKPLYHHIGFYPGLLWSRFFMGVFGLMLMMHPAVWNSFQKKTRQANHVSRRHFWLMFVSDKGLGVFGDILVQYAIALGSVSIVTALAGTQYALLVALVVLCTRFWPRFYHEDFKQRGISLELVGITLIVLGFILVV